VINKSSKIQFRINIYKKKEQLLLTALFT